MSNVFLLKPKADAKFEPVLVQAKGAVGAGKFYLESAVEVVKLEPAEIVNYMKQGLPVINAIQTED